ncbi:MAG: hypothetical protein ACRDR6_10805 [Pseudonocardiaceae bacterium]
MFTTTAHSRPANADQPNEDWYAATPDIVIVLDGATIRTDTGCIHDLPWYVYQLGSRLLASAGDHSCTLTRALADAISGVSAAHSDTCDLTHPGTPSAATGVVRVNADRLEWLVLGDITVMTDTPDELLIACDERVSQVGVAERRECDKYPLGSPEKMAAIHAMKPLELAARNTAGGYWIASVDPSAPEHAIIGSALLSDVSRFAVCSDGAMRALSMTSISTHKTVLSVLHHNGPSALVDQVRLVEERDATGMRRPRNKATDDATAVVAERIDTQVPAISTAQRDAAISEIVAFTNGRLMGATPVHPDWPHLRSTSRDTPTEHEIERKDLSGQYP